MRRGLLFGLLMTVALAGATVAVAGTGYGEFGNNDTARNFNGTGWSWCMGKVGNATWCEGYLGIYKNDKLSMKWNAEWDRGNAENWAFPPYDAWENNHWNGKVKGGSGAVWMYKIIWVGPLLEAGPYWRDGGYAIWGQFEVIMDKGHDAAYGDGLLWFAKANPNGVGNVAK